MTNLSQFAEAFGIFTKYAKGNVRMVSEQGYLLLDLTINETYSPSDISRLMQLGWCYSTLNGWYIKL